jgi:hypothetical protein
MCNRFHPVQKRLCRWLLMPQDRIGSDRLPFTQQFMADILGVRLASVSEAASPLQRAGLIRYNRGVSTARAWNASAAAATASLRSFGALRVGPI